MATTSSSSSSGVGFFGLLTILFITLKLTNYVAWSWWWVFAPIWGPFAIIIAMFIGGFLIALLWERRKR